MANVLIVDDQRLVRFTIAKTLLSAGHSVAEAEDGEIAITACRCMAFDLVLTDLVMPNLDGVSTIKVMRTLFPDVRLIVMSGGGHAKNHNLAKTAKLYGADAFLEKPFHPLSLLDTVRQVMNEELSP
jgi:CheY-like chemotaxis protein